MSSSTDNADNITSCTVNEEGDVITAKQLTAQIEDLSIEGKEGDIPTPTNYADDIITCAACGKEGKGDSMNMCNKCKMAKYCNAACKKKHRKTHKKKCDIRVAELHEEALFKDPPQREECPICFLLLPLDFAEIYFQPCCAKYICFISLNNLQNFTTTSITKT